MQQPVPGSSWSERRELVLEGGGKLPGAKKIVDIRDRVLACTADRDNDRVLVRGQLQVFVYYDTENSRRVQGQGAEIPWHCEVPIPANIKGRVDARVVDVKHDHAYDPKSEHLRHTMHLAFEVWNIEAAPSEPAACCALGNKAPTEPSTRPVEAPAFEPYDDDPEPLQDLDVDVGVDMDMDVDTDEAEEAPLPEPDFAPEDDDELQRTDVVVADTIFRDRLDFLEERVQKMRGEYDVLRKEFNELQQRLHDMSQPATEEPLTIDETSPVIEEPEPAPTETTPQIEESPPVKGQEVLTWRPFPGKKG
jgi:hypothetical protein